MAEPRALPRWIPVAGVAVALAALIAWSFQQRWAVLSASPFPLGIDGYFYPVQLRSLLEHGELQYPASPLGFWLLAPFAWATDPIVGTKLGAAVLGALVALPAYGIGGELGREDGKPGRAAGLVCAAIATSSAGSMYLTIEFVKNGIGITVGLTALWLVLRVLDRPSRLRAAAALLGIVAAVLTHKTAAALVLGIAVPAAVVELRARGRLDIRVAIGSAVLLVALVAIGLAAPQRFLSLSDLRLLDGLFTSDADWEAPALTGRLYLQHEPVIGVMVAFGALVALLLERSGRGRIRVVGGIAIGLGLLIGLPWLDASQTQGLALRLRAIAFVPLAINAALIVDIGLRHLRVRLERAPPPAILGGALAAVIVLVHVGGGPRTEGQITTHPALIAASQALTDRLPDGAVAIVPERHIAFMVAWYARVPISIRPEAIDESRRWRVLPLAFIQRGDALDDALLDIRKRTDLPRVLGLHPNHPNGMVAVPEPTWRAVLDRLPDHDRALFTSWPTL